MKETILVNADLSCREKPPAVYAKEGDADSREVCVTFYDGEYFFSMVGVAGAEMRVLKPDGTLSISAGTISADNKNVRFLLSEQALSAGGEGSIEFVLYGSGGEVISSAPARLVIIPRAVGDEAAVSTNEYLNFKAQLESFTNSFVIMSEEEYAAISPAANTVYFVYNSRGGAAIYYGTVSMGSSSGSRLVSLSAACIKGFTADCTKEE